MKKLLTLLALTVMLVIGAASVQAQSAYFVSTTNYNVNATNLDTVTNAGTRIQRGAIVGRNIVSVQVDLASLTGTPNGTVTLWGSNTGVNFIPVPSLRDDGTFRLDTLTVGSSKLTKIFRVPESYYTQYQVNFTGSTTQTTTLKTFAIWRQLPQK